MIKKLWLRRYSKAHWIFMSLQGLAPAGFLTKEASLNLIKAAKVREEITPLRSLVLISLAIKTIGSCKILGAQTGAKMASSILLLRMATVLLTWTNMFYKWTFKSPPALVKSTSLTTCMDLRSARIILSAGARVPAGTTSALANLSALKQVCPSTAIMTNLPTCSAQVSAWRTENAKVIDHVSVMSVKARLTAAGMTPNANTTKLSTSSDRENACLTPNAPAIDTAGTISAMDTVIVRPLRWNNWKFHAPLTRLWIFTVPTAAPVTLNAKDIATAHTMAGAKVKPIANILIISEKIHTYLPTYLLFYNMHNSFKILHCLFCLIFDLTTNTLTNI